jgi:hypothetical protein
MKAKRLKARRRIVSGSARFQRVALGILPSAIPDLPPHLFFRGFSAP